MALVVVCAVLLYIDATRPRTVEFLTNNWGNIASVLGFFLSLYVLAVAKAARAAAEEAVSAERFRTELEDIVDAAKKCTQIGMFAQDEKWLLVRLWAVEVESTCRSTVARWDNNPTLKDQGSKLIRVANLMSEIIDAIDNDAPDKKTILEAQHASDNKLSAVLGKMKQDSRSA